MFKNMKQFFEERIQSVMNDESDSEEQSLRLATAALMIEMTRADDEVTDEERQAVDGVLQELFAISEEEAKTLAKLAAAEVDNAACLFDFTKMVDQSFTQPQKQRVVEMLWRVAFSDAHKDHEEEYLVRKISDLIHVSHENFIKARHRVEEELAG
ncbi:MAG: TerB family tellurite resistance protein [Gammaproteobacteria bacterium]|nr:TerB family tellurite resistance protein [Gammaproteobacteria bacterium]